MIGFNENKSVIKYPIDGAMIPFFGNSVSTTENKFNRVAMIAMRYGKIINNLNEIIRTTKPSDVNYRLATALMMIIKTGIRIGNEDSAEGYITIPNPNSKIKPQFVKTYGLTTMLPNHLILINGVVFLNFLGKKHVQNMFKLDRDLSKLVINVYKQGLSPVFGITDYELTKFIEKETSPYFSSKDFRTFRANVFAYEALKNIPKPKTKKDYKAAIKEVAEYVSGKLNNTTGVVKKSYIDPRIFDYYLGTETQFDK